MLVCLAGWARSWKVIGREEVRQGGCCWWFVLSGVGVVANVAATRTHRPSGHARHTLGIADSTKGAGERAGEGNATSKTEARREKSDQHQRLERVISLWYKASVFPKIITTTSAPFTSGNFSEGETDSKVATRGSTNLLFDHAIGIAHPDSTWTDVEIVLQCRKRLPYAGLL